MKHRSANVLLCAIWLCAVAPAPARGQAQAVTSTPDTHALDGSAWEFELRMRWLNAREHPGFKPFQTRTGWFVIDSVRPVPGAHRVRAFHLAPAHRSAEPVRLIVGASVAPAIDAPFRRRSDDFPLTEDESIRTVRSTLTEGGAGAHLPEARVWQLLWLLPASALELGMTVHDTLSVTAEYREDVVDGAPPDSGAERVERPAPALTGAAREERPAIAQALRIERAARVIGDSTAAGRELWIVTDSASVTYEERWITHERTLDTLATTVRTVTGGVRGRSLYDPAARAVVMRTDTVALAGSAVLSYPDGRTFTSPVRYEGARRWTLHDADGRRVRVAALDSARRARATGMLRRPSVLRARVRAGDVALRDSLAVAWRRATDPDDRARIIAMLEGWSTERAFQDSLRTLRLQEGDTTGVIQAIVSLRPADRIVESELDLLLPLLRSPGAALARGISRDVPYENLRDLLLRSPPVLATDSARWPCTPAACLRLAAHWDSATEPRLRDLALVARVTMAPAGWADTVLARVAAGSVLLRPAALLVHGVGATWRAASQEPVPPATADWRAWLEWMNGTSQEFRERFAGRLGARDRLPGGTVRFEPSHAVALRFLQARTGRDIVGELIRSLAESSSDSARLVYDAILLGIGARKPVADEIAVRFLTGSPAARSRARRELRVLFDDAQPADSATAAELLGHLLAVRFDGAAPWPYLEPEQARGDRRMSELDQPDPARWWIEPEDLPAAVRVRWQHRPELAPPPPADADGDPAAGYYERFSDVVVVGPFARVRSSYTAYHVQEGYARLQGYAGGTTLYLLRTDGGWVVVDSTGWIT